MSVARPALPEAVIDAAIHWAVKIRCNPPTPATQAAFDAWMARDATHPLAWARVQSMVSAMAGVRSPLAVDTLRNAQEQRAAQGLKRRAALRKMATLGILAPATFWLGRQYAPWQRLQADYSTRTGQRQHLRLPDGTQVDLNSDTAIAFQQLPERRLVTLLRGEIYVQTGKDPALTRERPFFVATPQGMLEALGTRFTVRLEDDTCRLAVMEGAVRLSPVQGAALVLQSGQSGWLSRSASGRSAPAAMDAKAWTDGVISGRDMRLDDVLAEIARYRHGRIVCDPDIAARPISGTLQVEDTDALLRFLARTHALKLTYFTPLWVHVAAADEPPPGAS
ncbi:FecR domain-containing protein [Bordetella genomosp. 12]|uniref:Iron dicitrate transport regulator FecR n=1 Tax=Bordetella genomosp. 12 TaxID=463035 RepID=A0A261VCP6_9BORD|nr:FecR domain-containing protein [Bordetella genomosp. 12]OZI71322.1 hypothetical protein CAL22_15880 [Bordetella genomosp. 12]